MAKTRITTRVAPGTVRRIASELGAEVQRINQFSDALSQKLAETAASYAQDNFENAEYDGINDVRVAVRKTAKGNYSVTATGRALPFIEYGAGVTFDYGYPGEVPARFGGVGDYGKGHGAQDGWRFEYSAGVETTAGGTVYKGQKRKRMTYTQLGASGRERHYTAWAYTEEGDFVYEDSGKTWVYTHGNPPNACMYYAFANLIEDDFDSIVDEVRDAEL